MKTRNQPKAESVRFRAFFVDQIKDIYWAEKHLCAALKKMQKAATSPRLAEAFANHSIESERQIERLDKVFELLGKKPQAKKCDAMEGLISEAESVIEDTQSDTFTRDAGLILAAQKAEHYEIASYGTLRYYAELMGETAISRELGATLKEEKAADSLLTCLTAEGVREPVVAD